MVCIHQFMQSIHQFMVWIHQFMQCIHQYIHHQSSLTCSPVTTGFLSPSILAASSLLASSSSFFNCSCWLRMVSRSLAMKRSTNSVHSWSFLSCPLRINTSRANIQKTVAIALGTLLLQGMTISTYSRGASVLQKAMVGMLTYEASITACLSFLGSATTRSLGYWNFLVI